LKASASGALRRLVCLALTAGLLGVLAGCAGFASHPLERAARDLGFAARDVPGAGFVHRLYVDAGAATLLAGGPSGASPGDGVARLHIYIDGDGTPWFGPGQPSADPGPRNPLILRLMALDPRPAIYLGRPCYAAPPDRKTCHPWHWTHGRYAGAVVASMERVLRDVVARAGVRELILIGYSGGGALAMLLAARVEEVTGVVTLAGNLDVRAWTDHHGYSTLTGSLDPAEQPPLPSRVRQWHWLGEDDRAVPPGLVSAALSRQPDARVGVLPRVDHSCCWEQEWPRLLHAVEAAD
jgi:pimeloyl-ACP methyl ester carboxylesterase